MKQYHINELEGKLILLSTILASGMAFLDGTVVNIAVPSIQAHLNATISDIQWMINGYALFLGALILISGALGDRFGRRKIFSYGILLFTLSSLLCGLSHTTWQLILFRALQGVGGAMMIPGSLSIINTSFQEKVRGRAIGLWSGFAGGVAAVGPFLGGWLVQTLGWQSIFFINVPIGILAFFLTLRFVPETRNHETTRLDLAGTILIFLSLLGIVYGLISGPVDGWGSTLVMTSLAIGLVTFLAFIFVEKKEKEPLVPFEIFKNSLVIGANLATFFLYFALSGVIFFLVLNLQQVQHFSPIAAGLSMLPTVLIITFLSGYGGSLADRIGPRLPMIIGPAIVAVGMSLLALTGRNASYLTGYLPGLVLFGLGMSIVIAPLTKSALAVHEKYSGAASGVNNAVSRVAGLLAVALLGAVIFSLFKSQLATKVNASSMNVNEKREVMNQQDKLAGITIPTTFSSSSKSVAEGIVADSFIYGFRWAMGINAALAFLSAIVAYFTIHATKRKER